MIRPALLLSVAALSLGGCARVATAPALLLATASTGGGSGDLKVKPPVDDPVKDGLAYVDEASARVVEPNVEMRLQMTEGVLRLAVLGCGSLQAKLVETTYARWHSKVPLPTHHFQVTDNQMTACQFGAMEKATALTLEPYRMENPYGFGYVSRVRMSLKGAPLSVFLEKRKSR